MSRISPRAVLLALIGYQIVMYGFVIRAYLHMSVVLLPYLMGAAGYRLYDSINIGYPPGWLWLNAGLYRLLPDHELRLRLGTVVIAVLITLLIYPLARRWWGTGAGLAAAALFAAWGPLMLEYLMYFEFALGLLGVMALAVWHQHDSRWWQPLLAGVLVGLAVLVKQHALAVGVVFVVWRLAGFDWKAAAADVLRFIAGLALPLGVVALLLAAQGVLNHGLYLMLGSHGAYFETAAQPLQVQELAFLALWLALVPPLAVQTITRREHWSRQNLLLLGLLAALLVPAYPRYGRFHLAGAVPIVALISAGSLRLLFEPKQRQILRLYGGLAAAVILVVGAALPVYYRLRLGSIESQYAALQPLHQWVNAQTGAPPGTRLWILPDIDPTTNFYALGEYLPPAQYAETYPWIVAAPDVLARVLNSVEADPPEYVVRVDDWRFQIPEPIWDYVDGHYSPIAQAVIPSDIHNVTLFRRNAE